MLRKWLILPAVALLVTLLCYTLRSSKPSPRRIPVPQPSPLMAEMQAEMFSIRNLFRNATSSHRNRKQVARSCEHLNGLARELRGRPAGRWRSVSVERWQALSDDLADSADSLKEHVLSRPEPSLAAIRASYARIVDSCVRCHGENYLNR